MENLCYLSDNHECNTVASPGPNPRDGDQLPNPNKCNSRLMSGTRGEALTPDPNEYNSTPKSGTSGGIAPTYIYIYIYKLGEGVNYLTLMSAILC